MAAIDEHVVHDGKGKTRTTRCRHCSKVFTSRSKDRWRQHMRGCDNLPADFRRLFSSYERKPYARLSLGLSEAAPEAQAEHPVSPAPSYEPNSASSSPVTPTPFVTRVDVTDVTPAPAVGGLSPPVAENSLLRAEEDPVAESAAASSSGFLTCNSEKMTEILLIHGPCSFMRSAWTGGDVTKADLLREVQNLAVEQEISLVTHESNHEGTILDWLLNAKENEIIVLCWVGRLSGSPTILRALELVKNRVIIVSPRGVDHGALPSAVVGVLSGFGLLSFNLALAAAKSLNAQQCS
ncbi:Phospholipase D A [Phytophthora cinnamomi]|uniref:Phospholipase D A n=1 Tax=Phytophthora cinnamomi TaxID=4785 RepID=UPI003559DCBD|nr:Phospholipase D A [Phytophthora cinnamomi]